MTSEVLITELWQRCRDTALEAGSIPAEAVQNLIRSTRGILTYYGCSQADSDTVLYHLYIWVHWDWTEPGARIFETLLEIELQDFFKEWMDICNP